MHISNPQNTLRIAIFINLPQSYSFMVIIVKTIHKQYLNVIIRNTSLRKSDQAHTAVQSIDNYFKYPYATFVAKKIPKNAISIQIL